MKRNSILAGTILLTVTGLITRTIGFFYKIYLSNTLGAEKLGLYQLVFPVYSVCFTIYAVGIQTGVSQMVASEVGRMGKDYKVRLRKILRTGFLMSLSLAFTLSFLLHHNAEFIASSILHEAEAAASLRILAYVFPFCGLTSCINGFYYGLKKAGVPAFTQMVEQCVRVFCVFFIANYAGGGNVKMTCEFAVLGLVIGEIASNIFNVFSLRVTKTGLFDPVTQEESSVGKARRRGVVRTLGKLSFPLSMTRLTTSLLQSLEAILIPSMLRRYGMSASESLSIYGILTGMSIPFILFPSTITNSLSTLLLPAVSEAYSVKNESKIRGTAEMSIKYSILIGIFSTGVFLIFGDSLGTSFFHEPMAGTFLAILSWLCPFLYLSTTLNSVINGMGKTHLTFFNTTIGLGIRILFVVFLIPQRGISGYLIGMLVSQLTIALLDYIAVSQFVRVSIRSFEWILIPSLIMLFFGYIVRHAHVYLDGSAGVSGMWLLLVEGVVLTVMYCLGLVVTKVVARKDF